CPVATEARPARGSADGRPAGGAGAGLGGTARASPAGSWARLAHPAAEERAEEVGEPAGVAGRPELEPDVAAGPAVPGIVGERSARPERIPAAPRVRPPVRA